MNDSTIDYRIIKPSPNTKSKICINADTYNNKLYQKALKHAHKSTVKLKKSKINLNIKIEEPPKPNNYERLIQLIDNVSPKPCFKQSEATIYLYENGYILDVDYKASEAISFAKKIKRNKKKSLKRQNLKVCSIVTDMTPINLSKNRSSIEIDEIITEPIQQNLINRRNTSNIISIRKIPKDVKILKRQSNLYPNIINQGYIQNNNRIDSSDDEAVGTYGFNRQSPRPSAPPYEETNYIFNNSKC